HLLVFDLTLLSTAPAPTAIYTLSLHDALPISLAAAHGFRRFEAMVLPENAGMLEVFHESGFEIRSKTERGCVTVLLSLNPTSERSEEHTSELQSLRHLVCRLLLEKKKGLFRIV